MTSHTNQVTWSDHDSKWNPCDSIWNRRKGGNVEVILDQKDLGITNRLRRTQGRPNRPPDRCNGCSRKPCCVWLDGARRPEPPAWFPVACARCSKPRRHPRMDLAVPIRRRPASGPTIPGARNWRRAGYGRSRPPTRYPARGCGGGAGHRRVVGSTISAPDSDRRSFGFVLHAVPSTGLLFPPQHQQLRIGGEDLAQSVLKGAAGLDTPADVVH